jgi:hypothetical protein
MNIRQFHLATKHFSSTTARQMDIQPTEHIRILTHFIFPTHPLGADPKIYPSSSYYILLVDTIFTQASLSSFYPFHLGSISILGGIVHISRSILFFFQAYLGILFMFCSYSNEPKDLCQILILHPVQPMIGY